MTTSADEFITTTGDTRRVATTLGVVAATTTGKIEAPLPSRQGPQVFSRTICRAPFPPRFRAPTTITKYSGETKLELWLADYQLACQLGGMSDDHLIIRNLPLFLSDSARA
jgi:hypothetical protein